MKMKNLEACTVVVAQVANMDFPRQKGKVVHCSVLWWVAAVFLFIFFSLCLHYYGVPTVGNNCS